MSQNTTAMQRGAGGVSGPLIGQPQAMPDLSQLTERGAKAWAGVDAQGLREGFTAADMATASAQGFRDGVASLSANAGEPRNAIDRDALIDAIAQGLHGTWHCTRVWEAWHVGTMSQDDFEPVDESETPTEIADAVLALLAAPPAAQATQQAGGEPPGIQALMCVISSLRDMAHFSDEEGGELMSALCALRDWAHAQPAPATQQGVAYAALPEKYYLAGGEVPTWDADQMRAFADATHALRTSNGQAPATRPAQEAEPLLDYAMQIAHERELRVTGFPHDEDGAKRVFEAAVMRHTATGAAQADSVQEDAARYRFLRDGEWRDTDLEPFIRLQLNTLWDAKIDAARAAQGFMDGVAKGQQARWQPIETAPKDGQAILVTDGMDCYCVEWDEEFDWWTVDDNKLGPFRLRGSAPTHWMKLPESPYGKN